MKTALAFLIIGLSSWFDFTVQDPIGSALTGLQSCTTRITQEQGQSLATLFSVLVLKYAQAKNLGSQSSCDSLCLINSIASFVNLVSELKNCGTNVIAETVANCVDADDDTKAAVLVVLTGKDLQLSSQTGFSDDDLLPAALCMLNEVGSEDGIPIITFIKNSGIPLVQYLNHIPSKLTSQLGITVNNVNGAAETLQGLSSLGSAASISSSGNLGFGPGIVSTVGQIPTQIISSSNGINGLASGLLNIPMQLLNQILSLVGLGRNLSGTSSSQQIGLGGLGSISNLGNLGLSTVGQSPASILSGLGPSGITSLINQGLGGNAGQSGFQVGIASDQTGLGGRGSILNLGNQGLSSVGKLSTDIISGLGPSGITSLINQGLNLGGNGRIASDQIGLGGPGSILSLGNLGLSTVGKIPASILSGLGPSGITSLINQGLGGNDGHSGIQVGIASDQTGLGSLGTILNLGNQGLSSVGKLSTDILSGLGPSGVTSLVNQGLGLGRNAGRIVSDQAGSILSLGNLGLSGVGTLPVIGSLANEVLSLGGNAASDQTDQLGAAVNVVNGAGVQSQGHGSLESGASVSSSGNLGLDGLALGGIGLIPKQIASSSSGIISDVVSGTSGLASGASGLASGLTSGASGLASGLTSGALGLASSASGLASGLTSGASELASGASSASGRVVGFPTQVVNIGGNAGILPSTTSSDKLGITLSTATGAGGLGSGASISSTGNLGLGGVPTQIVKTSSKPLSGLLGVVEQVTGGKGLLNGLLSG